MRKPRGLLPVAPAATSGASLPQLPVGKPTLPVGKSRSGRLALETQSQSTGEHDFLEKENARVGKQSGLFE